MRAGGKEVTPAGRILRLSVGKGRHPEQKAQCRGRQRGVKLKFMNITRFGCMDGESQGLRQES